MMPAVEPASVRVIVVPLFVVDRDTHLGRIAVVQAIGTTIVLVAPEILWVVHVRIVIKAVPVLRVVRRAPRATVSLLSFGRLGLSRTASKSRCTARRQKDPADHRIPPLEDKRGSPHGPRRVSVSNVSDRQSAKSGLRECLAESV